MQGTRPSALPRQSGGFRLVRELGRGGMGVVYEAHEIESGRVVALKVLAAELSVSGEAFERFRREARLAASISDARCVFVYGAHQVDESPAIAMELVGGETLQEKITRGDVIPVETAVRWAIDVVDGLEAAHRAGVIHRDVKPSNCFVTTDGQVKIGDFGLSRTLERDVELTQSGQFLGSPLYASPEQIRGRVVDARSDQYSCAATLYALLAGRSPFGGNNVGEVLARILSEPPPRLRSIRPQIPRELEKVVLRGMERDPEKRYRDLDAFRAALEPFSSQAAAAASIPRRGAAWLIDAALVAFVSSTIGTLVQSRQDHFVPDAERPWQAIPLATQLALGLLPFAYFALSEGLFATSLGKWMLGLRIAPVGEGPALWVRAIPRAFLYEVVSLLLLVPLHYLPQDPVTYALASPLVFVGTFAFRVSTMRKRNGWRGPYELWTGTRVIQSKHPFRRLVRIAPPPESKPERNPSLAEKLGEYRVLGVVGETASGPLLHARDERLERSVWIQFRATGPVASEERRSLNRPSRLRWLETLRTGGSAADVFESPGGCGLAGLARRSEPLEWPMAERALAALAEELARCEPGSDGARRWSANQVWIDRNWNVRLLDEPVPSAPADLTAVGLLGAAATALLGVGPARRFPSDLPVHAESLVDSLTGAEPPFPDLESARAALARSQAAAANVERRTRSAQIAVSTLLLALFSGFSFIVLLVLADFVPQAIEIRGVLRELQAGRTGVTNAELSNRGPAPSGPELDDESRAWRATVLSYVTSHGFGSSSTASLDDEERDQIKAARDLVPMPSVEQTELARARIREQRGDRIVEDAKALSRYSPAESAAFVLAGATALWTLLASLSAIVWPGGLSFRLFGLSVRRRDGRRSSRLFGLLRTGLFALPLTAGYAGAFFLITRATSWLGWTALGLIVVLHVAGIAAAILEPSRNPVDRLLRSRIVPR